MNKPYSILIKLETFRTKLTLYQFQAIVFLGLFALSSTSFAGSGNGLAERTESINKLKAIVSGSQTNSASLNQKDDDYGYDAAEVELDALEEDAIEYSNDFGVSVGTAKRRLRQQERLNKVIELLETIHKDRFAGAWIEHEPEYRVVVRLAGKIPVESWMRSMKIENSVPVDFETGAAATLAEMEDVLDESTNDLKEIFPTLQGVDLDVKTGEFVLHIKRDPATKFSISSIEEKLDNSKSIHIEKLSKFPIRVEDTDIETSDGHTRGGANLSSCTSGFVVRGPNGNLGYITAGHCPNSQTYFEFGGTSYSTTFIDEIRDADQDVQWHTTSHNEYPHFYANSTSSYRTLQSQQNRSAQSVGNYVCHRGKTTGYSCGNISSKTFQPTYTNACNGVTCSSVWIKVEGSSLKCNKGDSGGPWFNAYTAYGLYKGQSSSGNSASDCSWAFYSAPDYFGIDLEFE